MAVPCGLSSNNAQQSPADRSFSWLSRLKKAEPNTTKHYLSVCAQLVQSVHYAHCCIFPMLLKDNFDQ